jgi:hypothetical protein
MTALAESAGRPRMAFSLALLLFLALSAAVLEGRSEAQVCDRSGCGRISCGFPARPAPQSYWGELQPVDSNPLPVGRDSTAFDEFGPYPQNFYSYNNWYLGVDPQNGYLMAALAYGLQVWDLRTHPANPDLLGTLPYTKFPVWVDSAEEKWPLQDVSAPAGVDTIATLAGHAGIGIAIVDLADKTAPRLLYQNYKKNGEQVYATTLGNTQYAFLAASGGDPGGVFIYNLTQARQYAGCFESVPAIGDPVNCPGVYMGRIGNRVSVSYLHGVDNFIAFASGGAGVEIWNVADPTNPRQVLTGLNDVPMCLYDVRGVYGVAMWKGTNNHYYLGMRTGKYDCALQRTVNEARIYDVSCITGTCSGLGSPIFTQELDSGTPTYFVTFSRSFSTPFLYYGSDDKCRGGSQREWLFDVTNPASPHDITPPTGYWGWYYRGSPTGFNNVMPRRAKFNNEYLYRAGLSIFDIHRRTTGVAPTAGFTWTPAEIYPGTPVVFQDTSSAFPNSWNWTFTDVAGASAPPPKP